MTVTKTTSLFDVLASTEDAELERRSAARAIIAAQERTKARFANFVANSNGDLNARLALIDDEVRGIAAEAASEYDASDNIERIYLAATAVLGAGHASDCSCGFCANKGKLPGAEKAEDKDDGKSDESEDYEPGKAFKTVEKDEDEDDKKESAVKTACACGCSDENCKCSAENPCGMEGCGSKKKEASWTVVAAQPETGDSYQSESVSLPTADASGLGGPSPEIDKGKSGDVAGWSLEDIDVGSKKHRLEKQDATERADYNDPDFLRDLDSPVHEDADVTKAASPPDTDGTKTWTGTEGLASPVTSRRWTVVE